MPTAVRVRGKKGNKRRILLETTEDQRRVTPLPSTTSLSKLEALPNELIQAILWDSLNLNLTLVSPILARKLNNNSLRRRFVLFAFFKCSFMTWTPHRSNGPFWGSGLEGNPGQSLRFYQDRHGTSIDWPSQYLLANEIMDQAWFSINLLFSCQKEYLSKIVPQPFSDLLHPRFTIVTKPWTVLQQNDSGQLPPWFVDLSHLRTTDEQLLKIEQYWNFVEEKGFYDEWEMLLWHDYGEGRFRVSLEIFPIHNSSKVPISDFNKVCRFKWFVEESEDLKHEFSVAMIDWTMQCPEPNHRLFNPVTWTMESADLLSILTRKYDTIDPSPEFLDAISQGLASAILQKFLPALFVLCSVRVFNRNPKMGDSNQHIYQDLVWKLSDYARWRYENGDIQSNTICVLRNVPSRNSLCPILQHPDKHMRLPINSDHLITAMESACEPKATVGSYYIFCWISINFITDITNRDLPFPERTLKQIHRLELMAGDSEYATQCYEYFNTALDKVWSPRIGSIRRKEI
ncbi:MAG: hypothetical protein GOMPHAMPRED_004055 [Gomphillus americanus]|uniref:Uncharacterized protein n=1 Tax=Gomphillus americanus TaxID=1940652 RepID=A0A8H3FMH2_9LECA|nr:MAG: hypothetical protein GOMPHAMPRED_004055 [Gomphillus americanus]